MSVAAHTDEDREQLLLDALAKLQREQKKRGRFLIWAIVLTCCLTFLTSYFVVVSTSNHCSFTLRGALNGDYVGKH